MAIVLSKRLLLIIIALVVLTAELIVAASFIGDGSRSILRHDPSDVIILIHVDEKKLYLMENGEVYKKYTVATGQTDFPSPIGDWKITSMGRAWGDGFGARWMGLDVPWGIYGIHGTNDEGRIGYAVSHGCIRMRNRDVMELYDLVQIGTPVIIRNGPYGPFGMGFLLMRPGDRGADVMAVQKRLKELGYYNGEETGVYDEDLKYAVHRFQKEHGLPVENNVNRDDYKAMGFIEFE